MHYPFSIEQIENGFTYITTNFKLSEEELKIAADTQSEIEIILKNKGLIKILNLPLEKRIKSLQNSPKFYEPLYKQLSRIFTIRETN